MITRPNMPIILGSSSKRRQGVLKGLGWDFQVMSPDIDEKAIRAAKPQDMVLAIATAKAQALLPKIKEPAILITADQVVLCNGEVREKPANPEQAKQFWQSYSAGQPAETISAVVVTNTQTGQQAKGVDPAKIFFKPVPAEIIDQLMAKGEIFTASGGFIHEDPLIFPYIDHMEGATDSISGLPLELLAKLITEVQ